MSPRTVTIGKDPDVWRQCWKKSLQPAYAIGGGKCILPVAVQTMNGNDAIWEILLACGNFSILPAMAYSTSAALQS